MDKNIRILVVNNDNFLNVLKDLGLTNVCSVDTTAKAIKQFVNDNNTQPFDVTFISEFENGEDFELLKSILEISPLHYVIMLLNVLSAEKILSSIKTGACGVLNKPFTTSKVAMELEKYMLLREDKKASAS